MKHLKTNIEWLDQLIPEGIIVPSSTIISGPGGSGKPIIGSLLVSSWLKQGGNAVVFLVNNDRNYAEQLFSLFEIKQDNYKRKIFYVDLNPEINSTQTVKEDEIQANLLKSEVWDNTFQKADKYLGKSEIGTLILGSALNLLFFSKTYKNRILNKIKKILKNNQNCVFSVSNNVFQEDIKQLENAADNLIFAHTERPMRLHMRIERMKDVIFNKQEIEVPLSEHELRNLRTEAEQARKHLIPLISKI